MAIVDDEPKIRRGFKKWINENSIYFETVYEARSAEEVLEKNKSYCVDLYFLDIHMDGLTGLELGRIIKKKDPKALIVYITGYDYFEYAHEAIKLQAFDYLLKPVPQSDFFKVLKKANDSLNQLFPERKKKEEGKSLKSMEKFDGSCSQIVIQGKEYIEVCYGDPNLSLDKAAQILNIHKDYFSKLMKEELGYTFIEYLTKVRVNRAKELLEQDLSSISMYDIAQKIGYKSQHYFSRIFKKYVGSTPLQYRNQKHYQKYNDSF
ncbi:MAG: response regulator [Clostridiaceae bacterium]|nr:response regulator [Clostridiaceae bacterium]